MNLWQWSKATASRARPSPDGAPGRCVKDLRMPQDPAPFPPTNSAPQPTTTTPAVRSTHSHAELSSGTPDPSRIAGHVERLRGWDNLVGRLERWYLDPRTQLFIQDLNSTGL